MIDMGGGDIGHASLEAYHVLRTMKYHESEISKYRNKWYENKSKINDILRSKKQEIPEDVQQMEIVLQAVSGIREVAADLQAKVGNVVHHLEVLSGVRNAAELVTQCQVLLELVERVMEEMTTALDRMQRNQHQLQQVADRFGERYSY